jgi:hypothetical protein
MTTQKDIYSLVAKADSAMASARAANEVLASKLSPRKRSAWNKEMFRRQVALSNACLALGLALHVQPFANDTLAASARAYASQIHSEACGLLCVLCD